VQVPVIDLGRWHDADPAVRADLAADVDAALREIGFMQIVGHGIDRSVIDRMLAAADEFYAQPLERKLAVGPPHPGINRGYAAMGSEALAYSLGVEPSRPDMFEAFNVGPDEVDRNDPFYAADPFALFAPNVWPDDQPELRAAVTAYFSAAHRVAVELTEVFAASLGLPGGWFGPYVDRTTQTMRVIRYEHRPDDPPPHPDQMRMGAHTDYGVVTVLFADPVPGLQIIGPDGQWHDVQPAPGALLVNLGDLTAQWTNDRWRSTVHRVVPPPSDSTGAALRRSVAYFLDANYDAVIECLPSCVPAGGKPTYPPVTAGEHLIAKIMGPRTLTASDATDTVRERRSVV
jgi:isopenicillin N synthase-like dioxygenase